MNDQSESIAEPRIRQFRFGLLQVLGIVALVVVITALLTAWWVKHYIYASKFTPTVLTVKEQKALNSKLAKLDAAANKDPVVTKEMKQDDLKNRNLVKEFGAEGGSWKLFSDGVADLKVQEGHILIKLKE
jgi:hypothetical protein